MLAAARAIHSFSPPSRRSERPRMVASDAARRRLEKPGMGDAGDPVGTLPQAVRRDFSAVGYAEAMRRAREIVPVLRERAQRSEDARMLIRENEQLLHESGLFRFHQPRAF